MQTLAQMAKLRPASAILSPAPAQPNALNSWMEQAAAEMNIGLQAIDWSYRDYAALLRVAAPAVLRVTVAGEMRFLLLLRRGQRQITVLKPDQSQVKLSVWVLAGQLRQQEAGQFAVAVDELLAQTGISAESTPTARDALLTEQLSGKQLSGCWLLQIPTHAPLSQHLRHSRITPLLALLGGITILQQIVTLVSWFVLGRGALEQNFTDGALAVWGLVLLTSIPITILGFWTQAMLSLNAGQLFRSRMLAGILNLRPSSIRHLGSGQFLERVIKTESFQALLLGGGLTAILALVQLITAIVVLSLGAGGIPHGLMLIGWIGLALFAINRYTNSHHHWSDAYRELTNDLVERMVGQRTRLAQASPATWHVAEDAQLEQYQQMTRRVDRWQLILNALVGRGWLIVGLAGIIIPFLAEAPNIERLAISIGGILLANNALSAITSGILSLTNARRAWQDVGPLLTVQPPLLGSRRTPIHSSSDSKEERGALLVARDVTFRYRPNTPPTLNGIDLQIAHGDRLLLEGASGGGKSTLASILIGMRQPESGLLLLHGLDQQTIGLTNWRQHVVAAPQFHENHILTETLAFNLLMGRHWPPNEADLQEAAEVCHDLGLGDLLARMPSGMQQMIGEGGWQLSHGERSRLFIARTLLQKADLVILDESFAALDPINLRLAIQCVLRRASTVLVIAHP